MDSWWQLGEWSGYEGESLAAYRITCPFCMERGNLETEHHAEKNKANSRKKLNFDTLKCGNCSGYVMVLWSANEFGFGSRLHDFRLLPSPLRLETHPKEWPVDVGRYWLQAKRSLVGENWDAAVPMARSSLQAALRHQGAKGGNLKEEINHLADRAALPPVMKDWSHEIRLLGNISAHPGQADDPPSAIQAKDLVNFLDLFLELTYSLPRRIAEFRKRQAQDGRVPVGRGSPIMWSKRERMEQTIWPRKRVLRPGMDMPFALWATV